MRCFRSDPAEPCHAWHLGRGSGCRASSLIPGRSECDTRLIPDPETLVLSTESIASARAVGAPAMRSSVAMH